MTMNDKDQDKKIDRIIRELETIKKDVTVLRGRVDALAGTTPAAPVREAAPPPPPPPREAPERKPPADKKELEAKIGGKWLNYVGILAVIVGMGFFIKYAFENEWIGPTGRVILGILVGLGFIGLGEYWKKKYKYYSQGLVGGGIAILFLALFGAASFYEIIPMSVGRVLFIIVTIFAVLLSVRYNASSIAFMGFLGGYLNPILLSTGENKQVALLTYIAILDLGVLIVAYFKNWKWLNFVALAATVVIFAGWAATFYSVKPVPYPTTELFLAVFFVIFVSVSIFYNVIHKQQTQLFDLIFIFLVASLFFGASYYNLKDHYPDWMGLFSGLMALFYFGLALVSRKRIAAEKRLVLTFLAVALAFLVIMVPIQLEKNWITIGWAVLAAALVFIGTTTESGAILAGGTGLLIFAIGKLLFVDLDIDIYAPGFVPFLNERFLTALVVAGSTLLSAYFFTRKKEAPYAKAGSIALFVAAHFVMILVLSLEAYAYFEIPLKKLSMGMAVTPDYQTPVDRFNLYNKYLYAQRLSLSIIWAIYSAALIVFGFVKRHAPSRILAIVLFAVTIFKVFIIDMKGLQNIYRIISFIGLGVILLCVSFLYTRFKDQIIGAVIGDRKEENNEKS
jgi:uncharacterized membrane protein